MERGLKERLVGAAVLVILAVVFIPMLLDDSEEPDLVITETNIPPKPENLPEVEPKDGFNSRIIPLEDSTNGGEGETAVDTAGTKEVKPVESMQEKNRVTAAADKTSEVIDDQPGTDVGLSAWVVQLGSFESEKNAQVLNEKLRSSGYTSFVEPLKQDDVTVYRVRVGPELKRSDAQSIRDKLEKSLQLKGIVVSYP